MKDANNLMLRKMMERQLPDLSHLKPPTELAIKKMIRNLWAAAKNSERNSGISED
jgi:hypothetical protein